MAVVDCIAGIIGAYHDASSLADNIDDRRRQRALRRGLLAEDAAALSLERSIARGKEIVQSQYDRDSGKLGQAFVTGDSE